MQSYLLLFCFALSVNFYPGTSNVSSGRLRQNEREGPVALFDGKTQAGWRGYDTTGFPTSSWKIEQGELISIKNDGAGASPAVDLMTTKTYKNYILDLDFRLTNHANSGILYRVVELKNRPSWNGAPEFQLLDDPAYKAEGLKDVQMSGSDYDMYAAKSEVLKPTGTWNHAKLVVNGDHIEHWLNGVKVVEYTLGSDDWKKRYVVSKFASYPEYGKQATGYIALQNHHEEVHFKNIRLQEL